MKIRILIIIIMIEVSANQIKKKIAGLKRTKQQMKEANIRGVEQKVEAGVDQIQYSNQVFIFLLFSRLQIEGKGTGCLVTGDRNCEGLK